MKYLRQVTTIALKDVRAELRTKEAINASLAFALMILLLFSYTFDPSKEMMREVSGGLLWIVFAFAGTSLSPAGSSASLMTGRASLTGASASRAGW